MEETPIKHIKHSRNVSTDITDKLKGGSAPGMASSRASNSHWDWPLLSPSLSSVSISFALFSSFSLGWILKWPHIPTLNRGWRKAHLHHKPRREGKVASQSKVVCLHPFTKRKRNGCWAGKYNTFAGDTDDESLHGLKGQVEPGIPCF